MRAIHSILLLAATACGAPAERPAVRPASAQPQPQRGDKPRSRRSAPPVTLYTAAALGAAQTQEAPPMLTEASPGVAGHVELGVELGRFAQVGLTVSGGDSFYDNPVPPPIFVDGDDRLEVTRVGIGPSAEAHLPVGPSFRLAGGGALHLQKVRAVAGGSMFGLSGQYYETSDVALASELRAGFDWCRTDVGPPGWARWRPAAIGFRAGWLRYSADLDELTDGAAALGGPFFELRLELRLTGRPN